MLGVLLSTIKVFERERGVAFCGDRKVLLQYYYSQGGENNNVHPIFMFKYVIDIL